MKRNTIRTWAFLGSAVLVLGACSDDSTTAPDASRSTPMPSFAHTVDATSLTPQLVNGGWWQPAYDPGTSVGTGVIRPFLDMQAKGNATTQEGFNTDNNNFAYNQHRTSRTNALPLNYVPFMIDADLGITAREFVLDAHESDNLFQIDQFEVWLCNDATAPNYRLVGEFRANALCELVYTIHDHVISATDQYSSGSGNIFDYRILVPESNFQAAATALGVTLCPYTGWAGPACGLYLIVWSRMSGVGSTFEEFSTLQRPVPGTLTIVKRIINDNGGTADVDDFNITTSAGALNFDGGVADGANTLKYTSQQIPVLAGSYTLIEGDVAGYSPGTWSCTGAPATATAYNAGSVTIADGETVVCTITNDDQQGSIKLVKYIVNDDGGTAVVGDFGIRLNGDLVAFGAGVAQPGDVTKYETAAILVDAGTHNFLELDVTGYTEGSWSCTRTAPSASGPHAAGAYNAGSRLIDNGEAWTCEITNNDDPGKIILIKRVDNLYGGTATAADFGILLNGAGVAFGAGNTVGTVTSYSTGEITVDAGLQTFSEQDVAGYTEGAWSCSPVAATGTLFSAGSVNVANGQTVTCEITNTEDQPPVGTETAWAANGLGEAFVGTLPYNTGNTGNWATYVAYSADKTVTLFAGKTMDVGTVHFSAPDNGQVKITITLTGGWMFEAGSVVAVQDYSSAPSGNPNPGGFDHKEPASGTTHEIWVPLNNFYGVHAVVTGGP
jgi:hypothetical protein